MTFPAEAEGNIKRRMLDLCQSHARNAVEITRQLALLVDNVADRKRKAARQNYDAILKVMEENAKNKSNFLGEVASVGNLLINRDDFLRLLFRLGEIADYSEAMGNRLVEALELKWRFDAKRLKALSELMGLVLKEVSKVRETLHSLSFDSEKAIETARAVEELERQIDRASRKLDLDLLGGKTPVQMLLFLRDIVDRAERIADIGADVVDLIRVLALTT